MQEAMTQLKYRGFAPAHITVYPVFSCFNQESALFMDQASSILRALSRVVSSFNNEQEQLAARRILEKTHRPQNTSTSPRKHDSVTRDSAPVTSVRTFNTLTDVCLEA